MRICFEDAAELLADLVAIPTVNPMGRPYAASEPVERKALERIAAVFHAYGVESSFVPCSPIHESLMIVVPGRDRSRASLLESHVDTVPADDWGAAAFCPRIDGSILYGRGACDDKGPLAAMILAVCEILESGREPPIDVVLMAAGDEEFAQTGIKAYSATRPKLARGVFGEPTSLIPVLQHKGTIRWDIVVQGRSVHSAQPELGVDAIRGAVQTLEWLDQRQQDLRQRYRSDLLTGPTITVTMVRGGRTRNAVADECVLSVDFRVLPGMQPQAERQELIAWLDTRIMESGVLWRLSHGDIQLATPPLATSATAGFSRTVLATCRQTLDRPALEFVGAPYGTDAAWVSDICPAIVLGPGSIDHAHAIDERVDLREVVQCARLYHALVMSECDDA